MNSIYSTELGSSPDKYCFSDDAFDHVGLALKYTTPSLTLSGFVVNSQIQMIGVLTTIVSKATLCYLSSDKIKCCTIQVFFCKANPT